MNYYLDPFTQIIRENGSICMLGAGAAGIRRYQLGAEQLQLLTRLMQAEALPEQTLREGLTEQVFEAWKALSWLTEERPDTVTLDSRTEAFYRAYGMQDAGGKLKERSVLILGCGGIGTHMAWHMTLLGVGSLTLVDYDTVEESNLNRQLLFDLDDVGKRKVEVLRQKLLRIRPDAKINAVSAKIENEQMLDEICAASHYDLIIKALDTPAEFPKWLDAVCRRRRIAYTAGITLQERAMIGPTFLPGVSETGLSDILPPPASEKIYGTAPSLGILLYHISDALAVESFRILTGCGRPQYCGKLVAENLFDGTAEEYGPAAQKPAVQARERERSADISTPAALLFAAAGLLHRTALPFGWLFVLLAPLLCRAPKAESGKRMFVNAAIMGLATFFRLARLLPSANVALTVLGLVGILGIVSLGIILTCALRKR